MTRLAIRTALVVALVSVATVPSTGAPDRAVGDSRVVAAMPARPGYPEGIVTRAHTVYVSTAARFGTAFQGPPEIQAFDVRTGELTNRYVIPDADPSRDHGLSGIAFDAAGFLYVLDTQWGLVRLDLTTKAVTRYSTAFPDLPPCSALVAPPCSPTQSDAPPLPNSIAFDRQGNAYVSDSLQATIWRILPTEGAARAPEVWFQDERLDGPFGTNGIRLNPARTHLYIAVFLDRVGKGFVYSLPVAAPVAGNLQVVHDYGQTGGPDEIAFGNSGNLYVTLASSNQISVLRSDGSEEARYSGPAESDSGPVPYDMPSGLTFHNPTKSLLVNNHAEFSGIPRHFVVFDVAVGDTGTPLEVPVLPQSVLPLT